MNNCEDGVEEDRLMNSQIDNDKLVQQREREVFDKIYYGQTSELICPYCYSQPLRFSYTFVDPDVYGIWISCTFCEKEAHLRLKKRPPGFEEKYILEEFQKRDEQAVKMRKEWHDRISRNNE